MKIMITSGLLTFEGDYVDLKPCKIHVLFLCFAEKIRSYIYVFFCCCWGNTLKILNFNIYYALFKLSLWLFLIRCFTIKTSDGNIIALKNERELFVFLFLLFSMVPIFFFCPLCWEYFSNYSIIIFRILSFLLMMLFLNWELIYFFEKI